VTSTQHLIDDLVKTAGPVRRLRPPLLRAAMWLAFAAFVLGLIAIAHGLRSDIAVRLHEPVFVLGMTGALVTGVLAAVASFRLSLPDASRRWLLLPAPALGLWLSTIGYGCLTDWVSIGPDGIHMGEAVRCFATLLLTSIPLSAAMMVMLRYAALLRPTIVSATGGLAVAAITAFALSLFHDLDATVMILVWNVGVAAVIAVVSSLTGRKVLMWTAFRLAPAPVSRP
jgi:hypothetical protein